MRVSLEVTGARVRVRRTVIWTIALLAFVVTLAVAFALLSVSA